MDFYISGSSSHDKLLQDLFSQLCDSGSLDYFTDNSTNFAGTYTKAEGDLYSGARCTMTESTILVDLDGNGTIDSGKKVDVFMHKRSAGGSVQGVVPVADNQSISFMRIVEGIGACGTAAAGVDPSGVPVWVCSNTNLISQIPTAGISVVEPALFTAAVNGGASFNSGEFTSSTTQSMTAVTFGIAVTKNLRDALQAVQGKTVGSDKVSDMPSLSRDQIASIFSNKPSDWTGFKVRNTDTNAVVSLTQAGAFGAGLAAGLTAPAQSRINICTRTAGSGTRALFNAYFMNNPCDPVTALTVPGDNTPASPVTAPTVVQTNSLVFQPNVPAVHENSSAGDIGTCLDNLNDGNNWGIAYSSLEKYSPKWRFIAIDGVAPTAKNLADNKYGDWASDSLQWRSITNTPGAGQTNLLKKIASSASAPTKLVISNDDFSTHDFILNDDGTNTATDATSVGYLALAKNFAASLAFSKANPVMTATHNGSADNLVPSSCRRSIITKNSWIGNN